MVEFKPTLAIVGLTDFAKPILANFGVFVFWPNFLNPKSPNPEDPKTHNFQNPQTQTLNPGKGADPLGTLRDPTFAPPLLPFGGHGCCGCWTHHPAPDPPPPDRPKFRFFFHLPPPFPFICVSLGVFSLKFGGVSFTRQLKNSKRAHVRPRRFKHHQNSTKGPPRERR